VKQAKVIYQGVSKIYQRNGKDFFAVKDADLEVFDNEILCLVGPSGCGKTTLLNIAAGLVRPELGRVLVDGLEVKGPSGKAGVVFQTDSVFPWMTVASNVEYGLRVNGMSAQRRKETVKRFLDLVGLSEAAEAWPRELSGGMKKRVDLARAYAFNPNLLLLDEPFGSLDVITKGEMQTLLRTIWQAEQKTVLFVTHDVEEAIFLGHRVAVMKSKPGAVKEIFDVPFTITRTPDLKLEAPFVELRRKITSALTEAAS
jgi:NitT/TauT family transport system ATP-binding protein